MGISHLVFSLTVSYHRTFYRRPILFHPQLFFPQDISSTAYLTTGHFIHSLSYHRTFHPQPILPPTFHPHTKLPWDNSSTVHLATGHFIHNLPYHGTFHSELILPQDISSTAYLTPGHINSLSYHRTFYPQTTLPWVFFIQSPSLQPAWILSECQYWTYKVNTLSLAWLSVLCYSPPFPSYDVMLDSLSGAVPEKWIYSPGKHDLAFSLASN